MAEATAQKKFSCPACGAELVQKNQTRLIAVGLCMIALVTVAFAFPIFWVPGVVLGLTGIYLLVWAVLGKGRWCRNCKNFGIGH